MAAIKVYSSDMCAYCGAAQMLLKKKRVDFDVILINRDPEALKEMRERTERTSVPQVFVGDVHVGGFDDLCALDERGELDTLLAKHAGDPGKEKQD
jgi:glutaredoxin 3